MLKFAFLLATGVPTLGLFRTCFFAPGAVVSQRFLPAGGDFALSKNSPGVSRGM